MKILHVVVSMDPALGGLPAVAMRLAAAQSRLGHQVVLCAHNTPERSDAVAKSMRVVPGIEKVQCVLLDSRVRAGTFISRNAAEALRRQITACDVVHLHGLWEPLVRVAARTSWKERKPYVLTPHGMLDPWCLQQRWLKKKVALALLFRRILNRAACLHVLNDDEARLLTPLRLNARVEVIPNGVFIEEIEPIPAMGEFRAKHPELRDDPIVLFLSRLHHKKGLDVLAAAFAHALKSLPNLRLVVAGPDEGAKAEFERDVLRLGVSDRTHAVGPIWGREKYAAIVDAACFCLPSRQEGFSMAITEALACGTPVVISENCHFPEVATYRAGEVTKLDAIRVAEALIRVVSSDTERTAMGRRGRELVVSQFVWPAIAERLLSVYRSIVESPTAGGSVALR